VRSLIPSIVLSVSLVAACTTTAAPADQAAMSCVERLELPRYPDLPRRARLRGDVEATVTLNGDGSVRGVTFAPHRPPNGSLSYFHGDIEQALRRSKFSSRCPVPTIVVAFEFRLVGNGVEDNYRSVAFRYPNRFEIAASEPLVDPHAAKH
jgi:hypothetical protein